MNIKNILFYIVIIGMLVAAFLIAKPAYDRYVGIERCKELSGKYDTANNVCLRTTEISTKLTLADIDVNTLVDDQYDGETDKITVSLYPENPGQKVAADLYAVPFAVNFGGSGTFLTLGLFQIKENGAISHRDSYILDDRAQPQDTFVPQINTIYLSYLGRYSGQSFAVEPSVPVRALFSVDNYKLMPQITYFNSNDNDILITGTSIVNGVLGIKGQARGSWFFESVLPVETFTRDGELIENTFVLPDSGLSAMTDEFVPFTLAINNSGSSIKQIRFSKDNSAGILENEAFFSIFIK